MKETLLDVDEQTLDRLDRLNSERCETLLNAISWELVDNLHEQISEFVFDGQWLANGEYDWNGMENDRRNYFVLRLIARQILKKEGNLS